MLAFGTDHEIREVDIPNRQLISMVTNKKGVCLEELLGLVFYYGQNEYQPQNHCSVSVGDVIELEGHGFFRVDPSGFSKLAPDVMRTYRKTPRRDRTLVDTWGERV
jgi:hypothetical protein